MRGTMATTQRDDRLRRRYYLAGTISAVLGWEWLDATYTSEARRHLPGLLIALYLADIDGHAMTMREACQAMGIDVVKTGPRYVRLAEERGLLVIKERPPEDRRKTLITATTKVKKLVEGQLDVLAAGYDMKVPIHQWRREEGISEEEIIQRIEVGRTQAKKPAGYSGPGHKPAETATASNESEETRHVLVRRKR